MTSSGQEKRCQIFEAVVKKQIVFWNFMDLKSPNHQKWFNTTGKCHGKRWWDGFQPTVIYVFLQTCRVSSFILGVFWLKLSPLGHDDSPYINFPCGVKQNPLKQPTLGHLVQMKLLVLQPIWFLVQQQSMCLHLVALPLSRIHGILSKHVHQQWKAAKILGSRQICGRYQSNDAIFQCPSPTIEFHDV